MVASPHDIARLVLGAVAGIVGYLPVLAVLVLTWRGRLTMLVLLAVYALRRG